MTGRTRRFPIQCGQGLRADAGDVMLTPSRMKPAFLVCLFLVLLASVRPATAAVSAATRTIDKSLADYFRAETTKLAG